MTRCKTLARAVVVTALAAAFVFGGTSAAYATKYVCQRNLEELALGLFNDISVALKKCKYEIAKAQHQGLHLGKAASKCEKYLKEIYGLTFTDDSDTKPPASRTLGKFFDEMTKLDTKHYCREADLQALGHLVTGINAPGGLRGPFCTNTTTPCTMDASCPFPSNCPGSIEFLKTWLAKAKEKLAWKEEVFVVGDSRQLLDAVINLDPGSLPCASNGDNCGTDCNAAVTAPAGFLNRPNLCMLSAAMWPPCRDHACTLSAASGATIQPVGAPIALSGRRLTLETCKLPTNPPGPPLPVQGPDFMLLINEPARTFQPPPVIPVVPALTVCLDNIRSEGWCDCSAGGPSAALNPALCVDHVTSANPANNRCSATTSTPCSTSSDCPAGETCGTCPETGAHLESNCTCGNLLNQPCSNPACTVCVNASNGGRCHPGTENSDITQSWTGTSGAGDCVDVNTVQFKLLPPALCINAMNQALAECNAPGAPPPSCVALGGVFCADARGPDGVACTMDDLVAPGAPTTIPFTTGVATSTIEDQVVVEGTCPGGMNCITDGDCAGHGSGICNLVGAAFGCGTGPHTEDCQYSVGPGAPLSCAQYESSNLSTWKLVGSFPALDGGAGLNDSITTFVLSCS